MAHCFVKQLSCFSRRFRLRGYYHSKRCHRVSQGFTLAELLVVIAIIAMLIAMLIPAIQGARAVARRFACAKNLQQLGTGALNHSNVHGHLPTCGWGNYWVGDADRGFGAEQPGGWLYTILPFIEQESLFLLPKDGNKDKLLDIQVTNAAILTQTPVSVFYCPSRRAAEAYQVGHALDDVPPNAWNANRVEIHARNDYAANGGDKYDKRSFGGGAQKYGAG